MHDVAAAAGVSQATVSLVLNSASGSRFSEETRKRVRDAVNRLGYRTNAHAKVLREGVAGMIGFIGDSVATSPFAGAIIEGAQQRAWEDGLLLLTVNTGGDKELEAASLDTMLSYKVAGVVYAAMYHRRLDVPEALEGVRSVVLNSQDRAGRLPSVAPDEVKGGYTATRRLLGCRPQPDRSDQYRDPGKRAACCRRPLSKATRRPLRRRGWKWTRPWSASAGVARKMATSTRWSC